MLRFSWFSWLLATLDLATRVHAGFSDGEVVKILFVGDEYLQTGSGLDVPNITASVLLSLTPTPVEVRTYAVSGHTWADHVKDADTPGNELYDLLGAGANETWDYIIFQEDSESVGLTVSNANLEVASQTALMTLVDLATLRNASSVIILPPAYYAGDVNFPSLFPNYGAMQNSCSIGAVLLANATSNATGQAIAIAPAGLTYASIFDLTQSSLLNGFYAQLPVGSLTPAYLYLPGSAGQLPSIFGSYLVGNTVASTLTGCKVLGKGYIPGSLMGTLWPNLLQSASDNVIFSPILNPPGFPAFSWADGSGPCQTKIVANGR